MSYINDNGRARVRNRKSLGRAEDWTAGGTIPLPFIPPAKRNFDIRPGQYAYTGTQWGPKDQSIRACDFEKLAPAA